MQPDENLLYISVSGRKMGSEALRKSLLHNQDISDHHPGQREKPSKERSLKPRKDKRKQIAQIFLSDLKIWNSVGK